MHRRTSYALAAILVMALPPVVSSVAHTAGHPDARRALTARARSANPPVKTLIIHGTEVTLHFAESDELDSPRRVVKIETTSHESLDETSIVTFDDSLTEAEARSLATDMITPMTLSPDEIARGKAAAAQARNEPVERFPDSYSLMFLPTRHPELPRLDRGGESEG